MRVQLPPSPLFFFKPIIKKPRINNQIRVPQVRLIDDTGNSFGVVETGKALEMARVKDLDLVEIAPHANPPVAKIIDFGKYLYQQEKQIKQQKAKQKTSELKLIKIGLSISEHDALVKIKKLEKFLEEGDKVKIDMFLRGRERANKEFARERFQHFLSMIQAKHTVEQPLKQLPTGFTTLISK